MVGTQNLEKAKAFYDAVCAVIDMELCWNDAQSVSYGKKADPFFPRIFVGYPFDGNASSVGNGSMTAFYCQTTEKVDEAFNQAMQHGGQSEGEPGYRPHYGEGFYAAYVRDPDGNKLAFVDF